MAVTEGKFNGDIVGIYCNGTNIAHSVDSVLSVSQDLPDSTTKDSVWMEHIRGNRSWEVSGSGLTAFDSSMSAIEIIDYILNASTVAIEFKTTNADDTVWSGNVSIGSTSFSIAQNTPGQFDFMMTGNGPLSTGVSYSADATEAFALYDSLGDGLTTAEKTAMATYIDAEVSNGNHAKKDYEAIYGLSGNNGLVDYIGNSISLAVSTPTHSVSGYAFNGSTQYLNTQLVLGVDTSLFIQDDSIMSTFLKTHTHVANAALFGSSDGTAKTALNLSDGIAADFYMNSTAINNNAANGAITNSSLFSIVRTAASSAEIYKDGVLVKASTNVSTGFAAVPVYAGAMRNFASVASYLTGTESYLMWGQGSGFSHSGHNTNLRALFTSLGTI